MGVRSRYAKARDVEAAQLVKLGANQTQIAEFFGVMPSTISAWRKRYPSFDAAISGAVKNKNERVKEALYSRAIGCSHTETKVTNFQGDVTKTDIIKHYPPDVRACETWLYNRDPENWTPKKAIESEKEQDDNVQPVNIIIKVKDAS